MACNGHVVPANDVKYTTLGVASRRVARLAGLYRPLRRIVLVLNVKGISISIFPVTRGDLVTLARFLRGARPFSFLSLTASRARLRHLFSRRRVRGVLTCVGTTRRINTTTAFSRQCTLNINIVGLVRMVSRVKKALLVCGRSVATFTRTLRSDGHAPSKCTTTFTRRFAGASGLSLGSPS